MRFDVLICWVKKEKQFLENAKTPTNNHAIFIFPFSTKPKCEVF